MDKILLDGSIKGRTFSGDNYDGEYPSPKHGQTYKEYYNYVRECKNKGFHLGDLSWDDWFDYLYGSPEGGGEHVRDYVIGEVPDNEWSVSEMVENDENENWY